MASTGLGKVQPAYIHREGPDAEENPMPRDMEHIPKAEAEERLESVVDFPRNKVK